MTYTEEELIPISALQHFLFCERQWALIHLEQVWEDNYLTASGNLLHKRVDSAEDESRKNVKIRRSLQLRSLQYGLVGIADLVEFRMQADTLIAHPVEYKRGALKSDLSDIVQLCAQGLCLEEMLQASVLQGSLFYGEMRRRLPVTFDANLRQATFEVIVRIRQAMQAQKTPSAKYSKKCENCSLIRLCMPKQAGACKTGDYMREAIRQFSGDLE